MYCAKCGYTSFDHTAHCTKCGYDWKKEKDALNLGWSSGPGFDWLNMPMPAVGNATAGFSFEPVASDSDAVAEVDLGTRGTSRDTLDLDTQAASTSLSGGVILESMNIADDALNLDVPVSPAATPRVAPQAGPRTAVASGSAHPRQPAPPVNTEVAVDGLEELLAQARPKAPDRPAASPAPKTPDLDLPEISLDLDEPPTPKSASAKPDPTRTPQPVPAPDQDMPDVVLDFGTPNPKEKIIADSNSDIDLELDFSSLEPEPLPVTRHPDAKGKELVLDMPEGLEWELEEEDAPIPPKKS